MSCITANLQRVLASLPPHVTLVVAAKGRSPEEVAEAVAAGATVIGENYVQDAEKVRQAVPAGVLWHFIGHLQKNKVRRAVALFDMIETVDSLLLAREIDTQCAAAGKTMPVLLEVNSGREEQKWGVLPEQVVSLAIRIAGLHNIRVMGLMTMGPRVGNPEEARPYFAMTRRLFEELKSSAIPNLEMKYLSMGMTASYRVAIEEGANMVRLGRAIFEGRCPGVNQNQTTCC